MPAGEVDRLRSGLVFAGLSITPGRESAVDSRWIVVADASRARFFACEKLSDSWTLREDFDNPQGRMKAGELQSDKPGSVRQTGSPGMTPRREPHTDPTEVEAVNFARELAGRLEKARTGGRFARTILVAPPHFLGLLRGAVSGPLENMVEASIDKDYTKLDPQELEERLRGQLA